jgi:hypothetical protein
MLKDALSGTGAAWSTYFPTVVRERPSSRATARCVRPSTSTLMPHHMHEIHPEHPLSEPQIPRSGKSAIRPQVAYFPSGVWPTF